MLAKLLKYDFRALNRIMLPLQGGVLLAAVVGSFAIRIALISLENSYSMYSPASSGSLHLEEVIYSTSLLVGVLIYAAIVASYWISLFLIARHYNQSFLRDEGYLAFTLPVSASQNLMSKVIAGSLWLFINMAILVFAMILLALIGFTGTGSNTVFVVMDNMKEEFSNVPGFIFFVELFVVALLAAVHGILQIYTSLNIGAVLARTHKVAAGIGIFVAINMIMQIVMSVVTFGLGFGPGSSIDFSAQYSWFPMMQVVVLPPLIIFAALVFVYFFVSKHLLTTKLNLD